MDLHVKNQTTKDRYHQVEEQFQSWNMFSPHDSGHDKTRGVRFITISRQYGCAGFRIGDKLAEILNTDENPIPWAVYDKKLVDMVCENNNLNRSLVTSLDHQRANLVGEFIKGIFTGEPSSLKIFKKIASATYSLASRGRVILIGRAAGIVTSSLTHGLHVRIVAPLEWRAMQVAEFERFGSLDEARKYVESQDKEREQFARDFMKKNVCDPGHYDMMLNQQRLGIDGIVKMVLKAMEL